MEGYTNLYCGIATSATVFCCAGSGLDDGEIAGITIAVIVFCVAVVICIAIGTFIVLKRKNKYVHDGLVRI